MAYRDHYLLSYGGSLYGNEQWSNSLRIAHPVGHSGPDVGELMIDDVIADLRAHYASAHYNTATQISWVKCNLIGPDGQYKSKTKTVERRLGGTTGPLALIKGTSTVWAPPQCSVAVTLYTAIARGAGSKGRFYPPAPAFLMSNLTDEGRLAESAVTATAPYVASLKTFLLALNNWPGLDINAPRLVVATPGGRNMPEGDNVPVTHFRVGRVIDTQRRRRNSLSEGTHPRISVT
jgi:hypothetical protein